MQQCNWAYFIRNIICYKFQSFDESSTNFKGSDDSGDSVSLSSAIL